MPRYLLQLFQHLQWADRRTAESLAQTPEPPGEALRLLGHLVAAEQVWLGRIRGEDTTRIVLWPAEATLAHCRERMEHTHAGFRAALESAAQGNLLARIPYRDSKGQPHETFLEDILLQVALHGAHHRGQIAALLRRAGLEPANTDFIAFARGQGSVKTVAGKPAG